jgi:peptidoglycan/LPS O-acetylase OafA/YrhL
LSSIAECSAGTFAFVASTLVVPRQSVRAAEEAAPAIIDRGYQPEVQGIRALAVGLVLTYHFWPASLTGGFVGVDIFFVVSGFLISSHMYREASSTGSVKIGRFWARRVRRLLPISLLVLLVSLLASLALLPRTAWTTTFRQIAASALYTQNWILAGDAVDYSAADNAATLVQHYWSLSVEEQFYLIWPIIFVVAIAIPLATGRRLHVSALARRGYVAILGSLATLFVVSLAYSVLATNADSARSYFVTPTRVWEFAAGSLVALLYLGRQVVGPRITVLAWAGLAMIVLSSLWFSGLTPFPGWVALFPVLGTCILLAAPGGRSVFAPRWWLSRKPLTFLGDISYGIYLWHWPLIVLARQVLGSEPGSVGKVVIIAATVALATASKRYVEDPCRNGRFFATTRRAMVFAVAGTTVIAVSAFSLTPRIDVVHNAAVIRQVVARQVENPCFGPAALVAGRKCASAITGARPSPGIEAVAAEGADPAYPGCQSPLTGSEVVSCGLGADERSAVRTVAIVGDSHASQWFTALDRLGKTRNWHVKTFTKGACPVTFAVRDYGSKAAASGAECMAYSHDVVDRIVKDGSISVVFATSRAFAYGFSSHGSTRLVAAVDGFVEVWRAWLDAGKKVVVLGEVPNPGGAQSVVDCLAKSPDHPSACSRPVAVAVSWKQILAKAAAKLKARGVRYMPMERYFCDRRVCYPIVGGLIVYRDTSHISHEYSTAMAPFIGRFLDRSGIT